MIKRIGPGNNGDVDDVRAACQEAAWEIDGDRKPNSRSEDAKPTLWQRVIDDAIAVVERARTGLGPEHDAATLESISSRLDALSPSLIAELLRDAHDEIAELQDAEETLRTEKADLEGKIEEMEEGTDIDQDLKEHGWSVDAVERALWRAGIISNGESMACGIARMMDDLAAKPGAA